MPQLIDLQTSSHKRRRHDIQMHHGGGAQKRQGSTRRQRGALVRLAGHETNAKGARGGTSAVFQQQNSAGQKLIQVGFVACEHLWVFVHKVNPASQVREILRGTDDLPHVHMQVDAPE